MRNVAILLLLVFVVLGAKAQDTVYVKDTSQTKTVYVHDTTTAHETLTGGEAAIKNTLGLGPRAGYYNSYNAQNGTWYVGAQLRLRLSPYFGIEGAADYRNQQTYTLGPDTAGAPTAKVSSVPLTVSAMVFIPVGFSFVPYGLGGVGWYYTITTYTNANAAVVDKNDFNFGYHIGLGLEIPVSEHASISADYRWLFLNAKFDPFYSTLNPSDSNGNVITGSIMFYF